MDNKKEPKGRFKYFADYPFQDVKTKSGKIKSRRVYVGDFFGYEIPKEFEGNEKQFMNKIKLFYSIIILLSVGFFAFAGLINPSTLNVYYVLLGFLATAICLLLILFTCGEFILFTRNNRFERSFADYLSKGLRTKTIALMVSSTICFVTASINILVNYFQHDIQKKLLENTLSAFAMLGIALFAWFFLKLQDSLKIIVISKKEL
jgi:hypothetical protein